MENNRKGCINRDKNGGKNIRYVFNYYKKTGKRPMKYSREYKFERIDQPPNPYNKEKKEEVVKCSLMPMKKVLLHHRFDLSNSKGEMTDDFYFIF
jgi:hypothetical protein